MFTAPDEKRKRDTRCKHKIKQRQCIDCGGRDVCQHKRRKRQCVDCQDICEHKRIRRQCVDCGGKVICEHKRKRINCKDCGGAGICEHQRQRNNEHCGGSSICVHQRHRSQCKDCRPAKFVRRSAADLDKLVLTEDPAWTHDKDKRLWTMKTDLWRQCTNVHVDEKWKRLAEEMEMPVVDIQRRMRLLTSKLNKLPM